MNERNDRRDGGPGLPALLLIVGLVGAAVRLIVLSQILQALPFYAETHPGFDMHTYDAWAQQIVAGDWLSRSQGLFFNAPLYPYMLAAAYALAGPGNVAAGVAMNGVVGVLGTLAAAALGRRLFGWWAGLAAGLAMALSGQQIATESMLLGDPVMAALCLGALWLVVELLHRHRAVPPPPLAFWILPGLVLGLMSLGRASNLLLAAGLAVVVARALRGRIGGKAALPAAMLVLGVALPVLPVCARNGLMHGRWTVQTNGPVTIYIGNAPGTPGVAYFPPSLREDGRPLGEGAYWLGKLGQALKEDPWSLSMTLLRKTLLLLNAWDAPDNGSYHFTRRYAASLRRLTVPPLALYVAGFMGLFLTRRAGARLAPLYVSAAVLALCVVAGLVNGRYKLPFMAVLTVFAGGGAAEVARHVRLRHGRVLGLCVAGAGALTFAFWPRGPIGLPPSPLVRPQDFLNNGVVLVRRGRRDEAREILEDGRRLFPRYARFTEVLAQLDLEAGRPADALALIERAMAQGVVTEALLRQRARALALLGAEAPVGMAPGRAPPPGEQGEE